VKGETTGTEDTQADHASAPLRCASYISLFTFHVSRPFLFAWHFLTAIPLSRAHHEPLPGELAGSFAWYPLIGLMLGGLLVGSDLLLSTLFPPGVVNLLLIVILVGVTRGLHQDGLADFLDGLAGGRTPADRLAIMRDGRIGAIGATGLILSLGLRYAALMALPSDARLPLLLCMPAVGRWAMVVGAVSAPYARTNGGLAAPFLAHLSPRHVLLGTLLLAAPLFWFLGPPGALAGLALAAGAARAGTALARKFLGGITGDTLGATNELVEILFLLAGPALLSLP
jgi:adenosylcobinamide-GDP ribazoletransferase